eukprot:1684554-Amphidinium_carterae.1
MSSKCASSKKAQSESITTTAIASIGHRLNEPLEACQALASHSMIRFVIHQSAVNQCPATRFACGDKEMQYSPNENDYIRALEECKPKNLVSDCKGVVFCLHALRAGRRQPKGRQRDVESRALRVPPAGVQIGWMKVHQSDRDADDGRVERIDLQGNSLADVAANKSCAWLLVGPKLRNRSEQWPKVRLLALVPEPQIGETAGSAVLPAAPIVIRPHQR